ncbi:hypothetical protein SAMN05216480_10612 [Pustulibacterium marinum]|uniref:Uncharacterized protein n=1 Tax=Pustulibacterium marinum TaxID=1224947 RepID=A0A1I7GVB4_9FLAO|nr:hypothetical protein SAMN05216480_10612 [Pustulibacterium marinum]
MNKVVCILIILFFGKNLYAQDYSDISYLKFYQLTKAHIDKDCFVDINEVSRHRVDHDTIYIKVGTKRIPFVARRKDNGFVNEFKDLSLTYQQTDDAIELRIPALRVEGITNDSLYTSGVVSYYYNNNVLDTITAVKVAFDKKNIAEILFQKSKKE